MFPNTIVFNVRNRLLANAEALCNYVKAIPIAQHIFNLCYLMLCEFCLIIDRPTRPIVNGGGSRPDGRLVGIAIKIPPTKSLVDTGYGVFSNAKMFGQYTNTIAFNKHSAYLQNIIFRQFRHMVFFASRAPKTPPAVSNIFSVCTPLKVIYRIVARVPVNVIHLVFGCWWWAKKSLCDKTVNQTATLLSITTYRNALVVCFRCAGLNYLFRLVSPRLARSARKPYSGPSLNLTQTRHVIKPLVSNDGPPFFCYDVVSHDSYSSYGLRLGPASGTNTASGLLHYTTSLLPQHIFKAICGKRVVLWH